MLLLTGVEALVVVELAVLGLGAAALGAAGLEDLVGSLGEGLALRQRRLTS
jgi:hypothetical protein